MSSILASKEMQKKEQINLIFDGLNTVANVTLNGHQLCACKNLFTKFVFPVSKLLLLKVSNVKLTIIFIQWNQSGRCF